MIEHFQLLRNVGQFDNLSPPAPTALTPFTLIYAENARGKTTLAAVLRSLATNNPQLVLDRHRLGAQHPPQVVVRHAGGAAVFQNGAWSHPLPDVAIFDDAFVSANVCSGIELQTAHRQNLHELILGAQGVALSSALQGHVSRIEEHNAALRQLAEAIPAGALGPYKIDAFCDLEQDAAIDRKIQEAERRLAAARSADAIRQRPGFQAIRLALHVGVIQKTAPKYDGRTFKRLLICRLRNLCGGEKGHRRGSYQDSNLQECVAFACPSFLLLDTSNK